MSIEAAVKAQATKQARVAEAVRKTTFALGDPVSIKRTPRGHHAGRKGFVHSHNNGEVGIVWSRDSSSPVWYLPHELDNLAPIKRG